MAGRLQPGARRQASRSRDRDLVDVGVGSGAVVVLGREPVDPDRRDLVAGAHQHLVDPGLDLAVGQHHRELDGAVDRGHGHRLGFLGLAAVAVVVGAVGAEAGEPAGVRRAERLLAQAQLVGQGRLDRGEAGGEGHPALLVGLDRQHVELVLASHHHTEAVLTGAGTRVVAFDEGGHVDPPGRQRPVQRPDHHQLAVLLAHVEVVVLGVVAELDALVLGGGPPQAVEVVLGHHGGERPATDRHLVGGAPDAGVEAGGGGLGRVGCEHPVVGVGLQGAVGPPENLAAGGIGRAGAVGLPAADPVL